MDDGPGVSDDQYERTFGHERVIIITIFHYFIRHCFMRPGYREEVFHACRICLHGVPRTEATMKKNTKMRPLANDCEYGSPKDRTAKINDMFLCTISLYYY